MKVRTEPLLKRSDYKHFRRTIKPAFSQRRKTLKNYLVSNGFSLEKVKEALKKLNLEENIRGEKLSIAQFGELSELLLK